MLNYNQYLFLEMPAALNNAAKENNIDEFKKELLKYWNALKKNITSNNQPDAYRIKGVSSIEISDPKDGFSNIAFTAMDKDGKTRKVKVYIPNTKDLTSIKDFYIDIDGQTIGLAKYTGIEKGASYVQLELAKILYSGKTDKKRKDLPLEDTPSPSKKKITLMPSPEVPDDLNDLSSYEDKKEIQDKPKDIKNISKNKDHVKIKDELNKQIENGILSSITQDKRVIPSLSMVQSSSKGKYTPTITISFRPVPNVSTERVVAIITDALHGVKQYISAIDAKRHGEKAIQVWIDTK